MSNHHAVHLIMLYVNYISIKLGRNFKKRWPELTTINSPSDCKIGRLSQKSWVGLPGTAPPRKAGSASAGALSLGWCIPSLHWLWVPRLPGCCFVNSEALLLGFSSPCSCASSFLSPSDFFLSLVPVFIHSSMTKTASQFSLLLWVRISSLKVGFRSPGSFFSELLTETKRCKSSSLGWIMKVG